MFGRRINPVISEDGKHRAYVAAAKPRKIKLKRQRYLRFVRDYFLVVERNSWLFPFIGRKKVSLGSEESVHSYNGGYRYDITQIDGPKFLDDVLEASITYKTKSHSDDSNRKGKHTKDKSVVSARINIRGRENET